MDELIFNKEYFEALTKLEHRISIVMKTVEKELGIVSTFPVLEGTSPGGTYSINGREVSYEEAMAPFEEKRKSVLANSENTLVKVYHELSKARGVIEDELYNRYENY